MFDLKTN